MSCRCSRTMSGQECKAATFSEGLLLSRTDSDALIQVPDWKHDQRHGAPFHQHSAGNMRPIGSWGGQLKGPHGDFHLSQSTEPQLSPATQKIIVSRALGLNIEPHNVQAIVWWLAATLGCSIPKWPLMGVGAWGLQSVFCGKIPIFF